MKLHKARYRKIERTVTELLEKHSVARAPVPIYDIARRCGATIQVVHFNEEISGLLLRNQDTAVIAVEKSQAPTRQRFTIAHELGHLLLHSGEELRVDRQFRFNLRSPESSTAEDLEEIEANSFAASLLMPQSFLQNDVRETLLDIDDEAQLKRLAHRYQVSVQAMTIRVTNLLLLGHLRV